MVTKYISVCSAAGVVQSQDLTKASMHDVHYLKDVKELFSNCIITGDKGYIKEGVWKIIGVESKSQEQLFVPGFCILILVIDKNKWLLAFFPDGLSYKMWFFNYPIFIEINYLVDYGIGTHRFYTV